MEKVSFGNFLGCSAYSGGLGLIWGLYRENGKENGSYYNVRGPRCNCYLLLSMCSTCILAFGQQGIIIQVTRFCPRSKFWVPVLNFGWLAANHFESSKPVAPSSTRIDELQCLSPKP